MKPLTICWLAMVLFGASNVAGAAPLFGPGPHWVDTVTAGADFFGSATTFDIDLNGDLVADVSLSLSGPIVIQRGAAADTPDPLDPGHLNHVEIELVSMELTAPTPFGSFTIRAGDGIGNLASDGPLYSPGAIDEQESDPSLADAYLDLFLEIETPWGTFHNNSALHLQTVIDQYPPLFAHALANPLTLVDSGGNPTPISIVNVTTVTPEPSTLALAAFGFVGLLAAWGWRRRKA